MFKKRGENFKIMEREVKTSWRELIKSFISSDSDLEKQENEEEIKFRNKYSKILSQSESDISFLESMLNHPDIKVKGKGRRQGRNQTRVRTNEHVTEARNQIVNETDKEIER